MTLITSFMVMLAFCFSYPKWLQQYKIKRWRKQLAIDKHIKVFNHLYANVNGFSLSQSSRQKQDAMEYTYGEIEFTAFIALLSLTKPNSNTIFYDLGSGTGKAILASAMVFSFKKNCGIEIFENLHLAAIKQQEILLGENDYRHKANSIQFINSDFLNYDFTDATLIFINASALFGSSWKQLNQQLKRLNPGTIVITTSKKLPAKNFVLIHKTTVEMSWGVVTAYIQQQQKHLT